jgi:hypothetical protein
MQVQADAQPLPPGPAGEPWWKEVVARSVQARSDIPEFDRREIGRDAYPLTNRETGAGPIVVGSAWLVLYLVAAIHFLAF